MRRKAGRKRKPSQEAYEMAVNVLSPISLDRRELVVGLAATALYSSSGYFPSAHAEALVDRSPTDLRFELDENNHLLIVTEYIKNPLPESSEGSKDNSPKAVVPLAEQWIINLVELGVLHDDVSLSFPNLVPNSPVVYELTLAMRGTTLAPARVLKFSFERNPQQLWQISLQPGLWVANAKLGPIDYRTFRQKEGVKFPALKVSPTDMKSALHWLFDAQFIWDRNAVGNVSFDLSAKSKAWTVAFDEGQGPLIFDRQARCDRLCIAWRSSQQKTAERDLKNLKFTDLVVEGYGAIQLTKSNFGIGNNNAFHAHFTPRSSQVLIEEPKPNEDEEVASPKRRCAILPFAEVNSTPNLSKDMQCGGASVKQSGVYVILQTEIEPIKSDDDLISVLSTSKVFSTHDWNMYFENGKSNICSSIPAKGPLTRTVVCAKGEGGLRELTIAASCEVGRPSQIQAEVACVDGEPTAFQLMTKIGTLVAKGPLSVTQQDQEAIGADDADQSKKLPIEIETATFKADRRTLDLANYFDTPFQQLKFANVQLLLLRSSVALQDADQSSIQFQPTAFQLVYDIEVSRQLPTSYLWLGDTNLRPTPFGRLDLTRAEINARRYGDLVNLTFRFRDLALNFGGLDPAPVVRPLPDDCRVMSSGSGHEQQDSRPILIVEFPPQHVMEQALFRPSPPPPPELELDLSKLTPEERKFHHPGVSNKNGTGFYFDLDPRIMLAELDEFEVGERAKIRSKWREALRERITPAPVPAPADAEKPGPTPDKNPIVEANALKTFEDFAADFGLKAEPLGLPLDQREYIGPFGLDPDGMALARWMAKEIAGSELAKIVDAIINETNDFLTDETFKKSCEQKQTSIGGALEIETLLEGRLPTYKLFREYYRTQAISGKLEFPVSSATGNEVAGDVKPKAESNAKGIPTENPLAPQHVEYFAPNNRHWTENKRLWADPEELKNKLNTGDAGARRGYAKLLSGVDDIPDTVGARLSNPTRLAFRVNCGPTGIERGRLPKLGEKDHIEFTFAGLTDWSTHDLSVIRRSQKLYEQTESGLLDAPSQRILSLNDADVLTFQGVSSGLFTTARQRLAEIAANLKHPPAPHETAIDLPSRVIMSPAQDAVWQTPRFFNNDIYADDNWRQDAPGMGKPAGDAETALIAPNFQKRSHLLWSTTLDSEAAEPAMRVVHSPDFRPGFLWSKLRGYEALRDLDGKQPLFYLPGNTPPPRGPFAPWYLGKEQSSDQDVSAVEVYDQLPEFTEGEKPSNEPPEAFCANAQERPGFFKSWPIPRLIAYLCGRQEERQKYKDFAFFRTSLDAYDRHELVVLSSAYGLPVLAKRGESGDVLKDSDQFEPPNGYELVDVEGDSAIYRPKTLSIRELTLTSMGGTLRHDTHFSPPASARQINGENLFDALSIERWQHWTVLGRDIYTEVVYKGFLFPLGFRASLVKITERTFLRNDIGYIKAYLRQRLFIRCGKPEKRFPVLMQPNGGRQFPCDTLTMLTISTPDIMDPSMPSPEIQKEKFKDRPLTCVDTAAVDEPEKPPDLKHFASGQLRAPGIPGLMFWPRTALTPEADIRFSISVNGRRTSLPLIFVDNTAAHEPLALQILTTYYNHEIASPDMVGSGSPLDPVIQLAKHKRTLVLSGQTLRYCDELKAGDCSLETNAWTIKAQGRRRLAKDSEGDNSLFRFESRLEGADQPPFYPAMETARVRLKQVERLTGSTGAHAVVQFDGYYVEKGFPLKNSSDTVQNQEPKVENTNNLEIYLNLVAPVTLSMGSNGDRSGGMYRPGGEIVAISRLKGPMGGASKAAPDYKPVIITDPGTLVARSEENFSHSLLKDVESLKAKIRVFQRYLSGETKLLGVVRVDKLIEYLGIETAELPVMKEVVEYGASAMHAAEKAAVDVQAALRDEVLLPLSRAVAKLQETWRDIQNKWDELRKNSGAVSQASVGKKFEPPTIHDVFPEIGEGLAGLSKAIHDAIAETDAVNFAAKLTEIYEAGRQLIAGLDRVAANPIGRLAEGLQKFVGQWTGEYEDKIVQLSEAIKAAGGGLKSVIKEGLKTLQNEAKENLKEDLATKLFEASQEIGLLDLGMVFPSKPVLPDWAEDLDNTYRISDAIAKAWQGVSFTEDDHKKISRAFIGALIEDQNPFEASLAASELEIKLNLLEASFRDGELGKLIIKIDEDVRRRAADEALESQEIQDLLRIWSLLNSIKEEFTAQRKKFTDLFNAIQNDVTVLKDWPPITPEKLDGYQAAITRVNDRLREVLPASFVADMIHVQNFAIGIQRIVLAAGSDDYVQTAKLLFGLLEPLIGTFGIDDAIKKIGEPLQEPYQKLIAAEKVVLEKLEVCDLAAPIGSTADICSLSINLANSLKNQKVNIGKIRDVVAEAKSQLGDRLPSVVADLEKWLAKDGIVDRGLKDMESAVLRLNTLLRADSELTKELKESAVAPENFDLAVLLRDGSAGGVSIKDLAALADGKRRIAEHIVSSLSLISKGIANIAEDPAAGEILLTVVAARLAELASGGTGVADLLTEASKGIKKFDEEVSTAIAGLVAKATTKMAEMTGAWSQEIDAVIINLQSLAVEPTGVLQKELQAIQDDLEKAKQSFSALSTVAASLSNWASPHNLQSLLNHKVTFVPPLPGNIGELSIRQILLNDAFDRIAMSAMDLQQRILNLPALIRRMAVGFGDSLLKTFDPGVTVFLGGRDSAPKIPGLIAIYGILKEGRNAAYKKIAESSLSDVGREMQNSLLIPFEGMEGTLSIDNDLLSRDFEGLKKANEAPLSEPKNSAFLRTFLAGWKQGNASPLLLVEGVGKLVNEVIRGNLFALIDFAAIRDELENKLKELVPLRATLGYSFGGAFPDEKAKNATAGIFIPDKGARLDIRTSAKIEFLNPKDPEFIVRGDLGRFSIKLVGDFLDAVTINFRGASFEIKGGGKPKLSIDYEDFKIGPALEFVQQLAQFIGPKDGSGFFIVPTAFPSGLEAGYGLSLPIITLGTISFSNVSLNASMIIPFGGEDALFKASLSRRDSPFTISVAPYGGSGFFSITANAEGIIGFEASFEYGGAGAFQFGPLVGAGRIMAGIYIRQMKVTIGETTRKLTEITGTFYAGGTASIWIFHFTSSLYVRLGMIDGNMVGEATFTFSFSYGFVEVDFAITVNRTENKMGNGAFNDRLRSARYASLAAPSDRKMGDLASMKSPEVFKRARRVNDTVCQSENWNRFKKYFDMDLRYPEDFT